MQTLGLYLPDPTQAYWSFQHRAYAWECMCWMYCIFLHQRCTSASTSSCIIGLIRMHGFAFSVQWICLWDQGPKHQSISVGELFQLLGDWLSERQASLFSPGEKDRRSQSPPDMGWKLIFSMQLIIALWLHCLFLQWCPLECVMY